MTDRLISQYEAGHERLWRLNSPAWESCSELRGIFALLNNQAKFVGGCVRDSLMGRPFSDIDIASVSTPFNTKRILENNGFRTLAKGLEFGTITAILSGDKAFKTAEITTLREDVDPDGRHSKIIFSKDWGKDASRRDFTFNAIYSDFDGSLFDPCGGIEDLNKGLVRFIGDPSERIREDYLRLLRFFRFYALFPESPVSKETLDAIKTAKAHLKTLSMERIKEELFKLVGSDSPLNAILLMAELEIWPLILDSEPDAETLERFIRLCPKAPALYRFAALLPPDKNDFAAFADRYRLSSQNLKLMLSVLDPPVNKSPQEFNLPDILEFLDHYGHDTAMTVLALNAARAPNGGGLALRKKITPEILSLAFPVSGKDLINRGMKEGVQIKETLLRLKRLWFQSHGTLDKDSLLSKI